jgi:hypothetical protein
MRITDTEIIEMEVEDMPISIQKWLGHIWDKEQYGFMASMVKVFSSEMGNGDMAYKVEIESSPSMEILWMLKEFPRNEFSLQFLHLKNGVLEFFFYDDPHVAILPFETTLSCTIN